MHKISYVCDGNQTEFAFNFAFFQISDVRVAINGAIVSPDDYSVVPNENMDGGIVVLLMPPDDGVQIDIFRQIHLERFIDYQPTAKIDPEQLNSDFNFLLEAFKDLKSVDIDISQWQNIHDNVLTLIKHTTDLIEDKIGGGSVLGIYNNLLNVLENALPKLINDYGSITEPAPNENKDDYGQI